MAARNWKNRSIWTRDKLHVLRGLDSAPIGSQAAGDAFKGAWTFDDADRLYPALPMKRAPTTFIIDAERLAHGRDTAACLGMMAQRLAHAGRTVPRRAAPAFARGATIRRAIAHPDVSIEFRSGAASLTADRGSPRNRAFGAKQQLRGTSPPSKETGE